MTMLNKLQVHNIYHPLQICAHYMYLHVYCTISDNDNVLTFLRTDFTIRMKNTSAGFLSRLKYARTEFRFLCVHEHNIEIIILKIYTLLHFYSLKCLNQNHLYSVYCATPPFNHTPCPHTIYKM